MWPSYDDPLSAARREPDKRYKPDPFTYNKRFTNLDYLIILIGSFTLAPIRAVLVAVVLSLACLLAKVGLLGYDFPLTKDGIPRPYTGWRLKLYHFYANLALWTYYASGFRVRVIGQMAASRGEAPVLVGAPHSSFMETVSIIYFKCAPVSRYENRTFPLIGSPQVFYQSMFVDRRTAEGRKRAAEEIVARAKSQDPDSPRLFIFPEGTNGNRSALIQFKQGAFSPGVPVQPVLFRYPGYPERADATIWTFRMNPHIGISVWMLLCRPWNEIEIEFLPPYNPSEAEKADSILYAKNVQLLMAERLNLQATDLTYKALYEEWCRKAGTFVNDENKNSAKLKVT